MELEYVMQSYLEDLGPIVEKLNDLMPQHDYTYEYTDDHRAWVKGSAEADKILHLLIKLPEDVAMELMLKHFPKRPEIMFDTWVRHYNLWRKSAK